MPQFKPVTPETMEHVMRVFADLLRDDRDPESRKVWAYEINAFLDNQLDQDAFGTEGQCDPRGDHRE